MRLHKLIALKEDTLRQLAIYFPRRGNVFAALTFFRMKPVFLGFRSAIYLTSSCTFRFVAYQSQNRLGVSLNAIAYRAGYLSFTPNRHTRRTVSFVCKKQRVIGLEGYCQSHAFACHVSIRSKRMGGGGGSSSEMFFTLLEKTLKANRCISIQNTSHRVRR